MASKGREKTTTTLENTVRIITITGASFPLRIERQIRKIQRKTTKRIMVSKILPDPYLHSLAIYDEFLHLQLLVS